MPEWGAQRGVWDPGPEKPSTEFPVPLLHPRPTGNSGDDADGGLRSTILGTENAVDRPGCQEDTEQTLLPSQPSPPASRT